MGKGDKKSRKGKIWRGTFGKRRPKKSNAAKPAPTDSVVEEKKSTRKAAKSEES
jgi:30S ribosomal protein S31